MKCDAYFGTSCWDGSCPIALADKYAECGMDVVKSCKDCPQYLGCEDCMMDSTQFCKKIMMKKSTEKKGVSMIKRIWSILKELISYFGMIILAILFGLLVCKFEKYIDIKTGNSLSDLELHGVAYAYIAIILSILWNVFGIIRFKLLKKKFENDFEMEKSKEVIDDKGRI